MTRNLILSPELIQAVRNHLRFYACHKRGIDREAHMPTPLHNDERPSRVGSTSR